MKPFALETLVTKDLLYIFAYRLRRFVAFFSVNPNGSVYSLRSAHSSRPGTLTEKSGKFGRSGKSRKVCWLMAVVAGFAAEGFDAFFGYYGDHY